MTVPSIAARPEVDAPATVAWVDGGAGHRHGTTFTALIEEEILGPRPRTCSG